MLAQPLSEPVISSNSFCSSVTFRLALVMKFLIVEGGMGNTSANFI